MDMAATAGLKAGMALLGCIRSRMAKTFGWQKPFTYIWILVQFSERRPLTNVLPDQSR